MLHWFLIFIGYTFVGCLLHSYTEDTMVRYSPRSRSEKTWVLFVDIWLWPLLWLIALLVLWWRWVRDPEMPTLKQLLLLVMSYESWITVFRWVVVLGFLAILGYLGPRYRNWPSPMPAEVAQPTQDTATSHPKGQWYNANE
jgi:hypothetical protein